MSTDNNDNNKMLIKWLEGGLNAQEKATFEKSEDYIQYKKIVEETNSWYLPKLNTANSFNALKQKHTANTISVSWYQLPVVRIAASLVLLLGIIFYFLSGSDVVTIETQIAETKSIELPDKSVVLLGPNSRIAFNEKNFVKNRAIRQSGKAFYNVEKGSKFTVEFENGALEVLGTSFEIRSSKIQSSVSCYSGSVKVTGPSGTTILTKGKGVNLSSESTTFTFDNEWDPNKSKYNNIPVAVVLKSIEKQFDKKIDYSDIDSTAKFTGEFVHSDFEIALKMVCIPMQYDFETINGTYVLKHTNNR